MNVSTAFFHPGKASRLLGIARKIFFLIFFFTKKCFSRRTRIFPIALPSVPISKHPAQA